MSLIDPLTMCVNFKPYQESIKTTTIIFKMKKTYICPTPSVNDCAGEQADTSKKY
jgi:hypothetical protein